MAAERKEFAMDTLTMIKNLRKVAEKHKEGKLFTWQLDITAMCTEAASRLEKLKKYEYLEEQGLLLKLPCKVGDTVYRICPKCNDKHDGSCENCAWRVSASDSGCDVYGLWSDGQFPPDKCTIVPCKVTWNYLPNLLKRFGKMVFLTKEEAEEALMKPKESEAGK